MITLLSKEETINLFENSTPPHNIFPIDINSEKFKEFNKLYIKLLSWYNHVGLPTKDINSQLNYIINIFGHNQHIVDNGMKKYYNFGLNINNNKVLLSLNERGIYLQVSYNINIDKINLILELLIKEIYKDNI